ncbi:MAG TPA: hypothetical protein VKY89_25180 [Thermoanaerobaculia bacterium]|jgi:hypothetical protein|nr:hypothetical protein [Thermoanaerobaculia bacterium]
MPTPDDLSTLMVLAGVLETPGIPQKEAAKAARVVLGSLRSDWAKNLGETMIERHHGPDRGASAAAGPAAPRQRGRGKAVRVADLQAVLQLAGLPTK